ncbi:MAG: hypothetical protein MZV70_73460 [Desulfobacterales bacterium]|nr:hypothetical protein [Desulfobacterales bacterium]
MPKIMPTTAVMSPAAGTDHKKEGRSAVARMAAGVCPDAEEGAVAERDLSREPDEDVQARWRRWPRSR